MKRDARDDVALATSLAVLGLGLAVLVGWHLHLLLLVQVLPGLIPMQYNSALCFLALGVAGIGLALHVRTAMFVGGSVAAVVGAAVIVEYTLGVTNGIDTFFFYPWNQTLSAHPGRMALTTAISFLLIGGSLAAFAVRPRSWGMLGIANSIPLSFGLSSLIAYGFQMTQVLPFSLGSQMALHTSVAILAFSSAMLMHAWKHSERGHDGLPHWGAGVCVSLGPAIFIGASAFFPTQSWRVVSLEFAISIVAVALITIAVDRVTTARVGYKGLFMTASPLVLVMLFVALVVHVRIQNESAQSLTLHSSEVLRVSQSLLTRIAETESAVRGFVITGDESFVATYTESLQGATETTQQLRALVADNPRQSAQALQIEEMIAQRTHRFDEIFLLLRQGNRAPAQEDIAGETGPELMRQVRAELAVFSIEEARLGEARRQSVAATWQRLGWLLVAGTSAAVLLAVILTLSFSGGISRRLELLRDNAIDLASGVQLAPALGGHDEIADLDRVFHAMAISLDEASGRERAHQVLEGQRVDARHSEAMRKTSTLQSAIFNSANFSCIALDMSGAVQIFSVGAERMLGYTAAEAIEKLTPHDLVDPLELQARAAKMSEEFGTTVAPGIEALVFKAARGIEDVYELTCIRKDGTRFPVLMTATALRDGQDTIIGYLIIGTDNTVRAQIEAARNRLDQRLRDQNFYTRSLIESNVDAMASTDTLGNISDVNAQMEALTGCSRTELIGAPFKDCFTDSARAQAGIDRALHEGKLTNYELTAQGRDGRLTVVSYNASTFHDRDGQLNGVFAAARDITELKLFERTLMQKNVELEDASRMKSEFLANMSHELRTPLNAIIGFSEVLRDGLMGDMTEKQRGFITDIYGSGTHLLSLINDILDLSKVESGKMVLELDTVDVPMLLASSLSIIREKAATRNIRVDIDTADDLVPLEADPRKIKQILYNLLFNAIKFSQQGGHVILRARRVTRDQLGRISPSGTGRSLPLPASEFTEFLEISVTDDGIGIAEDGMSRLFQPFSQIDSGLARKFEGTGLGLAMVKLLAQLHGGTVAVESAIGVGSCFSFWLPMRPATSKVVDLGTYLGPERVVFVSDERRALVVEDDPKSADLIRVQLEAEGFIVHVVSSAVEALEIASTHTLSLITLDILLPNMDGWQFLSRLKQSPALRRIPVVIISIAADRNKGFSLGAAAVMQKPISRLELYESLVDIGLFPVADGHALKVLVVDDDPMAVELIATRMQGLASTVLRAYGGREAISTTRRELPDVIVLDLMMPVTSGFDVVAALAEQPDTAKIPVLVVTAKNITAEDRRALNGCVHAIVEKADVEGGRFAVEIRRAMSGRSISA